MDLPEPTLPDTPPPLPPPLMAQCAVSGKLGRRDSMVEVNGQWVLPEHKDEVIESLRQGVALPRNGLEFDQPGLSLGSVLKTAWQLFVTFRVPLLILHVAFWLPLTFLEDWIESLIATGNDMKDLGRAIRLHNGIQLWIGCLPDAASLWLFSAAFHGKRIGAGKALSEAIGVWGRMIGAGFLMGLGIVLGTLLLIVPGLLFYVRTTFHMCFIVEGSTAKGSLEESWAMCKGHFWRIVGWFTLVTMGLVSPYFILGIIQAILLPEDFESLAVTATSDFLCSLPMIFILPFTYAAYRAIQAAPDSRHPSRIA